MLQLIFSLLLLTSNPAQAQTLPVNVEKSVVKWEGGSVATTHNGTIFLQSGSLDVEKGSLIGGRFVIDMNTIINLDVPQAYRGKLENHLKSDDFFGSVTFPTSQLVIQKATAQGNDQYLILADLTIRGISKPIEFPAKFEDNGTGYLASATFTFDRAAYEVTHRSGSFFQGLGDKLVFDEITIMVSLEAPR